MYICENLDGFVLLSSVNRKNLDGFVLLSSVNRIGFSVFT